MPRFLAKNGARNAPDLILKRRFFSEQSVTKRGFLLTFCYLGGFNSQSLKTTRTTRDNYILVFWQTCQNDFKTV